VAISRAIECDPQWHAFAGKVFLADHISERTRAQAFGKWRARVVLGRNRRDALVSLIA